MAWHLQGSDDIRHHRGDVYEECRFKHRIFNRLSSNTKCISLWQQIALAHTAHPAKIDFVNALAPR